jgi:hypothetical protein
LGSVTHPPRALSGRLRRRAHRQIATAALGIALAPSNDHTPVNPTTTVGADHLHVVQQLPSPARYRNRCHQEPGGAWRVIRSIARFPFASMQTHRKHTPTSGWSTRFLPVSGSRPRYARSSQRPGRRSRTLPDTGRRVRPSGLGWDSGWGRAMTNKAPALLPGPLTWLFFWHPQRDSNPCRHLERAQTVPHGGLWSACSPGRGAARPHPDLLNAPSFTE